MTQAAADPINQAANVAVVTETFPPEINGVSKTIGKMVNALLERGYRIQLFRPRQKSEPGVIDHENLKVVALPGLNIPFYRELRFGLPMVRTLKRYWREERPDVVQVVTEGPLGWAAIQAAKALKIRCVTEFHTNFDAYSKYYRLSAISHVVERYLRGFHNQTELTLVPTREMKQLLTERGYRDIKVVGRGIDTNLFNRKRRDPALRRAWGLEENDIAVIYVGRIAPEKNVALALSAFEHFRAHQPRAKFIAVGDGPARTDLEKKYPHVIFAGMQKGEALAAHYASADLFLFPSVTETFGNVVLEAMSSGLAIVAYHYAAAAQYLQDDVSAALVPFNEDASFEKRVESLARHPETIDQLKRAVRPLAQACGWSRTIDDLEDALLGRGKEGVSHVGIKAQTHLVAHGPNRGPLVS